MEIERWLGEEFEIGQSTIDESKMKLESPRGQLDTNIILGLRFSARFEAA
jgi:hypothetical protein